MGTVSGVREVSLKRAPTRSKLPHKAPKRGRPGNLSKRKISSVQGKKGLKTKRLKKPKPTTSKKADTKFSRFIRERDGKCVYPGCEVREIARLQCSHFFARALSSTRYDPDNCDALCYAHHYGDRIRGWEYLKMTDYRDFKLNQLGEERYNQLVERSRTTVQRRDAIDQFEKLYETTG